MKIDEWWAIVYDRQNAVLGKVLSLDTRHKSAKDFFADFRNVSGQFMSLKPVFDYLTFVGPMANGSLGKVTQVSNHNNFLEPAPLYIQPTRIIFCADLGPNDLKFLQKGLNDAIAGIEAAAQKRDGRVIIA